MKSPLQEPTTSSLLTTQSLLSSNAGMDQAHTDADCTGKLSVALQSKPAIQGQFKSQIFNKAVFFRYSVCSTRSVPRTNKTVNLQKGAVHLQTSEEAQNDPKKKSLGGLGNTDHPPPPCPTPPPTQQMEANSRARHKVFVHRLTDRTSTLFNSKYSCTSSTSDLFSQKISTSADHLKCPQTHTRP